MPSSRPIKLLVHVKKVEIFGFKSFGFKNTTVNFEPGLISISGPNGSGKSNILDAIIFAMGENKPKVMRVDKLRSLIHDIEGNRHGPKMARTSVHFDNSDRKIPVDSDTVEITREMDENGENNYYLNKKPTNRSHILDLLDVANAGLGQLNAVQQGTVTRISEFTSEEKRRTIEDLIGLSYFDEKKTEAVKQLDDADRRLEIALAKMGEIKKRIDELEEERNQKLRYDLIFRELNRYKAISAANKLKTIHLQKNEKDANLKNIVSEITQLDEERSKLRNDISSIESEKSRIMTQANDYSQAKARIDTEISTAMEQYEIDNSAIVAATKRIQQIDTRIPQIHTDLDSLSSTHDDIEQKIQKCQETLAEIDSKRKKINNDLVLVDSDRSKILDEQSIIASKKNEIDNKIKSFLTQLHDTKIKLSKHEHENEESQTKISFNTSKLSELESDLEKITALKTRLESMANNHNATIKEIKHRIERLNSKKSKTIRDLEELDLILEKSSKAAAQYESKIKTVKEVMHEDYTIAKLKEDAQRLGIIGLVYEMISWEKEYERSVLAASSDWIKAAVVPDFETLLVIAHVLREKNLPKLKIIPIDAIPNFKLKLPNNPGIIGILSDYVKCDEKFLALKTFLFGNVILTKNRDTAHSLSKDGYKTVTLEGEYYEPKSSAVTIDVNSKISKLTKIISMSTDIEGLLQSINLLKRYVLKKKHNLKKIEDSIEGYTKRLSLSEKGLTSVDENYSNLKSRISSAMMMKEQFISRIDNLSKRRDLLQTEISSLKSNIVSLNEQIAPLEESYSYEEQSRIAGELSKINEKKSEIEKQFTLIMNEYRENSSILTSFQTDANKNISYTKNLQEEELSLVSQREEMSTKITALEKEKDLKRESLEKLREKEQELISTSGSSIGQLKEFDDHLRDLTDKEREITKQINSLERRSDLLHRDLQDLIENESKLRQIVSAYGFDKNMETYDVEPIIHGLSTELNSLTALNAKAPETYIEVSSGYRSMSTRKNSLEEERNSIVKFIEDIEKDKRQTFLDAFDKVDKEIRLIFDKMTGGNAWLELQNEDDIFNSGISYLIQFPNKPKRESTSISGGEKTLAAIVFVLALQKLKPSPFYLFDEVDAHLDAPNSERLSKILEERSKESQFIMVSLKDSVVQKAKLIYGVYPKGGVSHIITYKDKRAPSVKTS